MEYAFVHTNPTSMPQNKAAIIISAYEGCYPVLWVNTFDSLTVIGIKECGA